MKVHPESAAFASDRAHGIDVRTYITTALLAPMMKHLLAAGKEHTPRAVSIAVQVADALIAELNK